MTKSPDNQGRQENTVDTQTGGTPSVPTVAELLTEITRLKMLLYGGLHHVGAYDQIDAEIKARDEYKAAKESVEAVLRELADTSREYWIKSELHHDIDIDVSVRAVHAWQKARAALLPGASAGPVHEIQEGKTDESQR